MPWLHRVVAILALAHALASCAHRPAATSERDIIAQVRSGALDGCRSELWPVWRFRHGERAFGALREAVTEADEAAKSPWAYSLEEQRLRGLRQTLDSLPEAATEAEWRAARAAAERVLAAGEREAREIEGAGFAAIRARLNVWNRAHEQALGRWREGDQVQWGALDCLIAPRLRSARLEYGHALAAFVEAGQWPDGEAGFGALNLTPKLFEADEIAVVCGRLRRAASSRPDIRGMWAFVRSKLECDPDLPMGAADYVERYEAEWPLVSAFLQGLTPQTLAQQLRQRIALEQFGRAEASRFNRLFNPEQRATLNARVAAPIVAADRDNTAWLRGVLAERDWFDDARDGAGAQHDGWLLIQHADHDPEFQREMLGRLERHLDTGRVARADYALLWDRVAVAEGRPQRFGTQMVCSDGEWVAEGGVVDPEDLDARRAAFGLQSWADYQATIARLGGECGR